jgi:hypothetical protein
MVRDGASRLLTMRVSVILKRHPESEEPRSGVSKDARHERRPVVL